MKRPTRKPAPARPRKPPHDPAAAPVLVQIEKPVYGGSFLANALLTALILWAGFTAARMVTHDVFDRRPAGLTVLNLAHELVTLEVMAVIISTKQQERPKNIGQSELARPQLMRSSRLVSRI